MKVYFSGVFDVAVVTESVSGVSVWMLPVEMVVDSVVTVPSGDVVFVFVSVVVSWPVAAGEREKRAAAAARREVLSFMLG